MFDPFVILQLTLIQEHIFYVTDDTGNKSHTDIAYIMLENF